VNRLLRDERGGVFALSAITIPVFLVIVALVVDAGFWFTHKRQLQDRADAGALAAGVEYTARWAACGGTPAQKQQAEGMINAAAHQYAGDPDPLVTPAPQGQGPLQNTEVTEQARINVEINSNAPNGLADPNTSWDDRSPKGPGPCDPQVTNDTFTQSTADDPAYLVDVGVRERDQRSLFGMFGVNLFRNEAHARVELKTASAGKGFLPIAVADQDIRQAEIRYYRECGTRVELGRAQLKQLPTTPVNYQTSTTTTWWGSVDASGGLQSVRLTKPNDGDCPGTYTPVGAEVRIAGVNSSVVDIDAYTCAELAAMQYTDCWQRVSNIAFEDSNPRSEPWFHEVTVTGGAAASGLCDPDAYFAKISGSTTSCDYSVSVTVDWNGLQNSPPVGRHCVVSIGGTTLDRPGCPNGVWSFSGTNSALGQSDLTVTYSCLQPSTSPPIKDIACPGTTLNTSFPIHSLFLGNRQNTSLMSLVRTSLNPNLPKGSVNEGPGAELHWMQNQGGPPWVDVFPTVGLEGSLYVGQRRVLRSPHCKNNTNSDNCDIDTSSPNSSQSIDCEPGGSTGGQGHDFVMFAEGCKPWYGPNLFDQDTAGTWWNTSTNSCPPKPSGTEPNLTPPWSPNGPRSPRRCVVKAPGFSPNVIADGIAAAIGNCSNIQSNSCQNYACTNGNVYNPASPDEWSIHGPKRSPRVVFIFIVPYGAYKTTSSQTTMPVLTFAAFYVTGWEGKGSGANQNPCLSAPPTGSLPDEDTNGGDIVGYFVDYAMQDAPGDPDSHCVIGQLQPCTPVLVR
jgi:hypothetical protein